MTNIENRIQELVSLRDAELAATELIWFSKRVSTHTKIKLKYNTRIGNLKKYGVEHAMKADTVKLKRESTMLSQYGAMNNNLTTRQHKFLNDKIEYSQSLLYNNAGTVNASVFLHHASKMSHSLCNGYFIHSPYDDKHERVLSDEEFAANTAYALKLFGSEEAMHYEYVKQEQERIAYEQEHNAWLDSLKTSKLNKWWINKLKFEAHTHDITPEYKIGRRKIDMLIGGDTCFEPCPTISHSSSHSYMKLTGKRPNDKWLLGDDYHYKRAKAVIESGKKYIIHWDWDSVDTLCNHVKENCNRQHLYRNYNSIDDIDDIDDAEQVADALPICIVDRQSADAFCKDFCLIDDTVSNSTTQVDVAVMNYDDAILQLLTFDIIDGQLTVVRRCTSDIMNKEYFEPFEWFVKNFNPRSIVVNQDLSKYCDDFLSYNNFVEQSVIIRKRYIRFRTGEMFFADAIDNLHIKVAANMLKVECDINKYCTVHDMLLDNGFVTLHDAGVAKYVWQANSLT